MHPLSFDNPWVRSVDQAQRRPPAWLAAILGVVCVALCVIGGTLAAATIVGWAGPSSVLAGGSGRMAITYLAVFLPLLGVAALARAVYEKRTAPVGWSPLPGAGLGLLLGGSGFALVLALLAGMGALTQGAAGSATVSGLALAVILVALQTGAEEVFFRGWLQPILCARWGVWAGLTATSVLFAAAHMLRAHWSPVAGLNLVLAGLVFGLLALRTGGLWAPFGAHFAWNWLEAAGVGMDPNPGIGPFGALVDLDAVGAVWITGGPDGLNGSLLTSGVLIILSLGLAAARRRAAPSAVLGRP